MNMNNFRVAAMTAALMLGPVVPAQAALLTWTLSGVELSDGTTATGAISLDPIARTAGSFNVSTFDGALTGYTFDSSNSGLYFGSAVGANGFILFANAGNRYFNFSFANPLDALGGEFALDTATSYECANCSPYRRVTAGSLTTLGTAEIPEPGTGALLLPTLGLMGWMVRRRKQRTAK